MHATKNLPEGFNHLSTLNLSTIRTALWLNLGAFLLLFFFNWLFGNIISYLRTNNPLPYGVWGSFASLKGWAIPLLFISLVFMVVLHEMVHAVFFWLFTHDKPRFALTSAYAFAAAPDWYIPRFRYIIVGMAPFVLISIIFLFLMKFVGPSFIPQLFLIAVFNAAGSFGDILVLAWVIKQPAYCLINDKGDIFSSFGCV